MNIILNILLVAQIIASVGIIVLVLMQQGKGANAGATFGGGASGSLFGASGSANFLSRTTSVLAAVFFACTLALAYFGSARPVDSSSVLSQPSAVVPSAPAASGPASQIPGTSAPAAAGAVPAPVPAPAASGAAQIPAK